MSENSEYPISGTNSITSVIPQVFYDFIARVIPGGLILLFGFLTYKGSLSVTINSIYLSYNKLPSGILLISIGLIISYGTSIILWRQIDWIRLLFFNKILRNKRFSTLEKASSYLYDYIKNKNYSAGARITKLRAEIHMTEVLAIGLIYCLLFNSVYLFKSNAVFSSPRFLLEIFIILFIIAAFTSRRYFLIRATTATHNYYLIFKGPDLNKVVSKICKLEEALLEISNKKNCDEIKKITHNKKSK